MNGVNLKYKQWYFYQCKYVLREFGWSQQLGARKTSLSELSEVCAGPGMDSDAFTWSSLNFEHN